MPDCTTPCGTHENRGIARQRVRENHFDPNGYERIVHQDAKKCGKSFTVEARPGIKYRGHPMGYGKERLNKRCPAT
ncbi:MAG: hypothetical protein QF783_04375, partial [Arenicellales bacterium]|nr:hypothetical protein [Arenicellales bacterium]